MTGLLCLSVWMLFHLRQKCPLINYDFQFFLFFSFKCLNKDHLLLLINQILLCFYRKYVLQFDCLILPFYHCESISPAFVQIEVETGESTARRPSKKQERNGFST